MNERLPDHLIKSSLYSNSTQLLTNSLGEVSFRRSAQMGIPLPGSNRLIESMDNSAEIKQSTIVLSVTPGSATMQ